jgi:hypothetical protein
MYGSGNDLKKLISHMKSINDDGFLKKYGRIVEITKVSMHNSTFLGPRVLVLHF